MCLQGRPPGLGGYVPLLLLVLHLSAAVLDLPRISISTEDLASERFHGNRSHVDHFKLLQRDGNSILIGARNIVYNISIHDLSENFDKRIVWYSTDVDSNTCFSKGKSESECQNYVRVLAKKQEGQFLVCGTNAYKPKCRDYILQENGTFSYEEFDGIGTCPFNPKDNSTFIYADGGLYAGTVVNFQGTLPIIYRNPLQTDPNDYRQLNAPAFVHSFEFSDFVFFFFRENSIEYMNCGKKVFSRVSRVCKNDQGASQSGTYKSWTTFMKSRLNCSVPGEYPFYFDEIQSVSDVITGNYGGSQNDIVYALFSTPSNSIHGTALCAYSMRSVMESFTGPFKDQENMNANWLPIHSSKVPNPRPGTCDNGSLSSVGVDFIKAHPLMDEAVTVFYGQPLLMRASFELTKLAVDPQVDLYGGGAIDVFFIGTDAGIILKVVNTYAAMSNEEINTVIVEEIRVFETPTELNNLQVVRESSQKSKLIIITDDQVTAIDVQRCHKATSCSQCVGLQDPYCVWDEGRGMCASMYGTLKGPVFQNITSGRHFQCSYSGESPSQVTSGVQTTEASVPPEVETCAPCTCPEVPSVAVPTTTAPLKPISTTVYISEGQQDVIGGRPYLGWDNTYVLKETAELSNEIPHGERMAKLLPINTLDKSPRQRDTQIESLQSDSSRENTGPVVSASALDGPSVYSAETLAIAVTTASVAAIVIGFIAGFLFSRKCRGDDYSHGYSDTPYLDSKLNKRDNLMPSADPNMYTANNKHINNLVSSYNPKNINGKTNATSTDSKLVKPAKCAYI